MKKTFLALACFFSMGFSLMAQSIQVMQSDFGSMQLQLATSPLAIHTTTIANDTFTTIGMRDYLPSSEQGMPCLPELVKMIEIPLCDGVDVRYTILHADTIDGAQLGINHLLMPAQPSRSKSDNSPIRLVKNNVVYATNAFYGNEIVRVEKVGIARDRNLATLYFSPVSYNPVTNQLIICKSVEATLTYTRVDEAATLKMKRIHSSMAFNAGVKTINALPMPKAVRTSAPVVYQIVAHSMFRGQLDSLIVWKQRKGYIVNVAYTDDANVGTTTTSIAAFLQGLYDNATEEAPAPTYVLLVGDRAQIPAFTGVADNGHITDLYYMTWTSGDIIPDCYYGRFSAQNLTQLTPQIDKTLMYERYAFADPSFLQKAILVSGVDGGYSSDNAYRYCDPTMDYLAKTYFIPSNGINTLYYYKNNTSFAPTGVTVTGSSQSSSAASELRALYNAGAGWVNYSAHGSVDEWSTPNFNNTHVANMTNNQKFGFMVGSCCLSNSFQSDCLGEALLQKGNYAGAVGYYGGSDYTYWAEDFYWAVGVRNNVNNTCDPSYDANNLGAYDRLFHTHNEAYSDWYTSAGAINMAGCMAVQSSSSSLKDYYWEVYHLMGDPSITPWFGLANTMTVSTNTTLFVGATSMTVTAVPYAYVALTDGNGTLIAAAFANASGVATLSFSALTTPGSYELAVSAQQYQTVFTPITVIVPNGPYVLVKNIVAQESLEASQPVVFNVELKNVGVEATDSLYLELQTNADDIYLSNGGGIQSISNLAANDSTTLTAFASGIVWGHVRDQKNTRVTAIVRWGSHSNEVSSTTFGFTVAAADIEVSDVTFSGTVAAGNSLGLAVTNTNQGHADLFDATASLISPDPCVSVVLDSASLGSTLASGASITVNYSIQLSSHLPEAAIIPLLQYVQGNGAVFCDTILLQIGSAAEENFETGNFNSFDWVQNGTYPWEITSSDKYAGTYSARSSSWNNGSGHGDTSSLSITLLSTLDDSISFYQKVSSEGGYDKFFFLIDGSEMFSQSGTDNDWERVAFPVSAGTHTFTFRYAKDYSVSRGSDCAFIDNIRFPQMSTPRNYELDTVCQGETVYFREEAIATDTLSQGIYYYSDSAADGLHFLMLTVIEQPELVLDADPDTIRRGESSLITVSGASRYAWESGERVHTMRVYPEETTTYTVVGYNGSCSATDSITVYVFGTIGIEESNPTLAMRLYPNPTNGSLQIDNLDPTQPVILNDLYGRTIATYQPNSQQISINISYLPNGIYLIRNGQQVAKIVKR